MDLKKLKAVLELFEESKTVSALDVSDGDSRIRLRKEGADSRPAAASPAAAASVAPPPAEKSEERGEKVVSPMVGTFYRAASPEAPPFVRVGQTVEMGQTLCIIEAMKLMNEIPSTAAGRVAEILVENNAAIGYGEPLFLIEPES